MTRKIISEEFHILLVQNRETVSEVSVHCYGSTHSLLGQWTLPASLSGMLPTQAPFKHIVGTLINL